jgi:DNA excision repair protein ERCC-6
MDWKKCERNQKYYLPGDFSIPKKTFESLFEHQMIGVQFLYNLWRQNLGAVLGDDMGLGKTI